MSRGAFTERVRSLIQGRAGGWCEKCGLPLRSHGQIHHRRPRGMGGAGDDVAGPENGVWVHPHCHSAVESNRADAYATGWLVGYGRDPLTTPIRRWGQWVFLTGDGGSVDAALADSYRITGSGGGSGSRRT